MTTATTRSIQPLLRALISLVLTGGIGVLSTGCSLLPDARPRERFHNPLPQLHRIAVLPFFNQSSEATLNQTQVAEAYYAELQLIPGFEVLPIGVTAGAWERFVAIYGEPLGGADFQRLARFIGVDAVVVGAVTDYDPYSTPRLAMTVRWYAADPTFHPVPVGYGLAWGTKAERKIPARIVLETELEVARSQLKASPLDGIPPSGAPYEGAPYEGARHDGAPHEGAYDGAPYDGDSPLPLDPRGFGAGEVGSGVAQAPAPLPLPAAESVLERTPLGGPHADGGPPPGPPLSQCEPVLTHTRIYRGDDPDFTERLADYVYAMDDGRLGGWQSYLTRSDDFIRFCCRLHITEMLEMRGGRDQSDLILRWPISRYWR